MLVLVMTPLIPGVLLYRKRLCRTTIEEFQEKAFVVDNRIMENKKKIGRLQEPNNGAEQNMTEDIIENEQRNEDTEQQVSIAIQYLHQQNKRHQDNIDKIMKKIKDTESENNNFRELVVIYKMTESALENLYQCVLQVTLLLMNLT